MPQYAIAADRRAAFGAFLSQACLSGICIARAAAAAKPLFESRPDGSRMMMPQTDFYGLADVHDGLLQSLHAAFLVPPVRKLLLSDGSPCRYESDARDLMQDEFPTLRASIERRRPYTDVLPQIGALLPVSPRPLERDATDRDTFLRLLFIAAVEERYADLDRLACLGMVLAKATLLGKTTGAFIIAI